MDYQEKKLNYALSGGAKEFAATTAVKVYRGKCVLEVIGTDMDGEACLEISASGENFSEMEETTMILQGTHQVIKINDLPLKSYIRLKVLDGAAGTLTKVRYLFG